jgi:hypothetical protein
VGPHTKLGLKMVAALCAAPVLCCGSFTAWVKLGAGKFYQLDEAKALFERERPAFNCILEKAQAGEKPWTHSDETLAGCHAVSWAKRVRVWDNPRSVMIDVFDVHLSAISHGDIQSFDHPAKPILTGAGHRWRTDDLGDGWYLVFR